MTHRDLVATSVHCTWKLMDKKESTANKQTSTCMVHCTITLADFQCLK